MSKMLIKVNETGFIYKVKLFFKRLFFKENVKSNSENKGTNNIANDFISSIDNVQNMELLNLQNEYRLGNIKEENLSNQQIDLLCKLYDKQISELKKSNELRKQKLLIYRKNNMHK